MSWVEIHGSRYSGRDDAHSSFDVDWLRWWYWWWWCAVHTIWNWCRVEIFNLKIISYFGDITITITVQLVTIPITNTITEPLLTIPITITILVPLVTIPFPFQYHWWQSQLPLPSHYHCWQSHYHAWPFMAWGLPESPNKVRGRREMLRSCHQIVRLFSRYKPEEWI